MGFTLTIARIEDMLDDKDQRRFREWLGPKLGSVNEKITDVGFSEGFPLMIDLAGEVEDVPHGETIEIEDRIIFCLQEVGSNWWEITTQAMERTLGPNGSKHASFIKPWFGVVVPFEVQNRHLINTDYHGGTLIQKALVWILMRFAPKDPKNRDIMIYRHDKKTMRKNLRIGSIPRILKELDAACLAWGLPSDETGARTLTRELYESNPEDDGTIARCYALMVRSFLRFAMANNHLVWFIK